MNSYTNFTHDHVISATGTTFAAHWVNHFFYELREAYLKVKLGGYRHYDMELEKLLNTAKYAMPEGSKERDAFWKVDEYLIRDDGKSCSELANQLNTLCQEIFGRNILPAPKNITVDYLVREEYSLCPQYHTPAYQRWLTCELKKKNHADKKHPDEAPLITYINNAAETIHQIISNDAAPGHQKFMKLLMALANLELEIRQNHIEQKKRSSQASDTPKFAIPFGESKYKDLKILRKLGFVTPDKLDEPQQPSDDEKVDIPSITQDELKDMETIQYLLMVAFDYHLYSYYRAPQLFKLLKALDKYREFLKEFDE